MNHPAVKIEGVVTQVSWVRFSRRTRKLVPARNYKPSPERDPMGQTLRVQSVDGMFQTLLPADEATERFYRTFPPFTRFQCDVTQRGFTEIHLTCLVDPVGS